jgi:UTP:GlnB (protein PII) uridylyltransferase
VFIARAQQADVESENSTPGSVITVDNESSELYTRICVNGENHPGLLTAITGMFRDFGCDVRKAEVSTQGSQVNDAFYIVDSDGKKLTKSDMLASLEAALNAIVEGQPGKRRRPSFPTASAPGGGTIKTELMSTFLMS